MAVLHVSLFSTANVAPLDQWLTAGTLLTMLVALLFVLGLAYWLASVGSQMKRIQADLNYPQPHGPLRHWEEQWIAALPPGDGPFPTERLGQYATAIGGQHVLTWTAALALSVVPFLVGLAATVIGKATDPPPALNPLPVVIGFAVSCFIGSWVWLQVRRYGELARRVIEHLNRTTTKAWTENAAQAAITMNDENSRLKTVVIQRDQTIRELTEAKSRLEHEQKTAQRNVPDDPLEKANDLTDEHKPLQSPTKTENFGGSRERYIDEP